MHGNSLKNPNPHHLYQIDDLQENEVFKFGISDEPIEKDGLSKRLRYQINMYNLVAGFIRFAGKVLVKNIGGRAKAKELEDERIDQFIEANGKRPRGNPTGGKRKNDF